MQRQKDPEPRTGAAYIGLGEACLTLGLVMHSTSFACLTSDWLYSFSISQSLIIMPGPGSDFVKNFTVYIHIGCLLKLIHGGQW